MSATHWQPQDHQQHRIKDHDSSGTILGPHYIQAPPSKTMRSSNLIKFNVKSCILFLLSSTHWWVHKLHTCSKFSLTYSAAVSGLLALGVLLHKERATRLERNVVEYCPHIASYKKASLTIIMCPHNYVHSIHTCIFDYSHGWVHCLLRSTFARRNWHFSVFIGHTFLHGESFLWHCSSKTGGWRHNLTVPIIWATNAISFLSLLLSNLIIHMSIWSEVLLQINQ